jgi:hypothetical protein
MRTHARNPDGSASGAAGYCSRLFCHRLRATTRGSILRSCHRSWSFPVVWMWWWRKWNGEFIAMRIASNLHRFTDVTTHLSIFWRTLLRSRALSRFSQTSSGRLCYWPISERDGRKLESAPPAWGARPFLRIPVQSAEAFDVSAPRYQMSFASLIAVTVIVPPGCKKHQQQPAVMDARPKSGDSPLLSRHDSSPKGWFNVWRPLFAGVQEAWSRDRSELKSRPVFIPLFRRFFQYPLWFLANRS